MAPFLYLSLGAAILCGAWIPLFLRNLPLSLPMLAVAAGLVLPWAALPADPLRALSGPLEHLTAIVLLTSIYGAGLNIDRRFAPGSWASAWRLLGLVMPISIALIMLAGMLLLGLSPGPALLLAAVLSPTDPVLASNVQVGPPGAGEEGEVRFALTSEAGMNDAMALPFVVLGLQMIDQGGVSVTSFGAWLAVELVAKVVAGAALGAAFGWLLVVINRILPDGLRLPETNSGIAGIGLSLLVYGPCELAGVNGFVAVFLFAVAIRNTADTHEYSRQMSHAGRQIERVMMVGLMALFGFAVAHGLLRAAGPATAGFTVLVLLVVRPVATLIGFIGSPADTRSRAALGYLGIRGIGSIYYLVYAIGALPRAGTEPVFAAAGLTVLASVVLYGTTSSIVMDRLDRARNRAPGPTKEPPSPSGPPAS
jgi:NhaP-type Na+/H+ or K+/H+ antiporter